MARFLQTRPRTLAVYMVRPFLVSLVSILDLLALPPSNSLHKTNLLFLNPNLAFKLSDS